MPKRIYITESQFKQLKEMAYPVSFNMDEMLSLPSYAARLRYCEQRLKKIGSGSSRTVYAVDDEKVLKVAKNKKGIAQNEVEGEYNLQNYGCFAKIYDGSDDYIYLEMQAARRAKSSDFKRLTGYDFEVMCAWIDYVHSWYARPARYGFGRNTQYDNIFKSEEFEEGLENYNLFSCLQNYLCDYCPETTGDLKRLSSWGVVKENGEESLVLIDFGLNDEVWDEYYSRKAL